ncbi:MAG: hypothetical protein NC548_47040 [Lachnospiraceae bacterium]|nr:hypothetical protein [Lachnospiraceae bacterium]
MNNYRFKITVPDGFDKTDESFTAMQKSLFEQFNGLDEDSVVLLFRIPDDFDFLNNESYLSITMANIRQIVAEYAANAYVIALQFDVECTDNHSFIQNISGMFDEEVMPEVLRSSIIQLLEKIGLKSSIILPEIKVGG